MDWYEDTTGVRIKPYVRAVAKRMVSKIRWESIMAWNSKNLKVHRIRTKMKRRRTAKLRGFNQIFDQLRRDMEELDQDLKPSNGTLIPFHDRLRPMVEKLIQSDGEELLVHLEKVYVELTNFAPDQWLAGMPQFSTFSQFLIILSEEFFDSFYTELIRSFVTAYIDEDMDNK